MPPCITFILNIETGRTRTWSPRDLRATENWAENPIHNPYASQPHSTFQQSKKGAQHARGARSAASLGKKAEGMPRVWNFCTSQRCRDSWYNDVLQQCREGRLHGYPTGRPTLEGDQAQGCTCFEQGAGVQETYFIAWAEAFCSRQCSAKDMKQLECAACQKESEQCCRVLANKEVPASVHNQPPMAEALMLHAFNVPWYYALLLRAKTFAAYHGQRIPWTLAEDVPLFEASRSWDSGTLQQKRLQRLEYHDQKTMHLSSLVPLTPGMPVRLTDTADDRDLYLYRGTRGLIVDWRCPEEAQLLETAEGRLLNMQPHSIYVQFADMSWKFAPDLWGVPTASCKKNTGAAQPDVRKSASQGVRRGARLCGNHAYDTRAVFGRLVLRSWPCNKEEEAALSTGAFGSARHAVQSMFFGVCVHLTAVQAGAVSEWATSGSSCPLAAPGIGKARPAKLAALVGAGGPAQATPSLQN